MATNAELLNMFKEIQAPTEVLGDIIEPIDGEITDWDGNKVTDITKVKPGTAVHTVDGYIKADYVVVGTQEDMLIGYEIPHSESIRVDAYILDKATKKFKLLKDGVKPEDLLEQGIVHDKDVVLFCMPGTKTHCYISSEYNDPFGYYIVGCSFNDFESSVIDIMEQQDEEVESEESENTENSEEDSDDDDSLDGCFLSVYILSNYTKLYDETLKIASPVMEKFN